MQKYTHNIRRKILAFALALFDGYMLKCGKKTKFQIVSM